MRWPASIKRCLNEAPCSSTTTVSALPGPAVGLFTALRDVLGLRGQVKICGQGEVTCDPEFLTIKGTKVLTNEESTTYGLLRKWLQKGGPYGKFATDCSDGSWGGEPGGRAGQEAGRRAVFCGPYGNRVYNPFERSGLERGAVGSNEGGSPH